MLTSSPLARTPCPRAGFSQPRSTEVLRATPDRSRAELSGRCVTCRPLTICDLQLCMMGWQGQPCNTAGQIHLRMNECVYPLPPGPRSITKDGDSITRHRKARNWVVAHDRSLVSAACLSSSKRLPIVHVEPAQLYAGRVETVHLCSVRTHCSEKLITRGFYSCQST